MSRRTTRILGLCAGLVLASFVSACRFDVVRYRTGNPIDEEVFEQLEVGEATRGDVMQELGAPDKAEWKSGDDYVWYLYADLLNTGLRFQFPPFRSLFGYQHTFLRLDETSEEVNALQLVFDEAGVLRYKSLRLSEAYTDSADSSDGGWLFQVTPYGDYTVALLGDGGFRRYSNLFRPGYRAGLRLGFQPVPVVTLLVGGNVQRYAGRSVPTAAGAVYVDDLRLGQLEVGFRFEVPLEILTKITDFGEVKRMFFEDDLREARGLRLYIEATAGATLANSVGVTIRGVDAGDLYRRDVLFSGSVGAGLEFEWAWGSVWGGATYQNVGTFDSGDAPLDGSGNAFDSVLVGGGLSLKF